MMGLKIQLPAETTTVSVRELPELMAEALYPPENDVIDQRITGLVKMIDEDADAEAERVDYKDETLLPDDWAHLRRIWSELPPYIDGISAAQWEPYERAWLESDDRPTWGLVVCRDRPSGTYGYYRALAETDYRAAIERAVTDGSLIVRSHTRIRELSPIGEHLQRCIITISDLAVFLEQFGFDVEVAANAPAPVQQQAPASRIKVLNLWNVADPRDDGIEPFSPWMVPARYFARHLVKENPSLLKKRGQLVKEVQKMLIGVREFKRGGDEPPGLGSINNSLSNVDLS